MQVAGSCPIRMHNMQPRVRVSAGAATQLRPRPTPLLSSMVAFAGVCCRLELFFFYSYAVYRAHAQQNSALACKEATYLRAFAGVVDLAGHRLRGPSAVTKTRVSRPRL